MNRDHIIPIRADKPKVRTPQTRKGYLKFPFHSVAARAPFRNIESPNSRKGTRFNALPTGRVVRSALIFSLLALSAGCEDVYRSIRDDLTVCVPGVELLYDYNEENSSRENKVEYWIQTIDEYIFDQSGILCSVRHLIPGRFASKVDLPEGRYSVIAVGNTDGRSSVTDASLGRAPVVGLTHREDLRLSLQNAEQFPDGTRGPSEELFHGYRTFSVGTTYTSRIRVDLVNAHFQLRFRIRWSDPRAEVPAGVYYAVLQGVSSRYALMPEWVYPKGSFIAELHSPQSHDTHAQTDNSIVHHIPETAHRGDNQLDHSHTTYLNANREIRGAFTTYRAKCDTPLTLAVHHASGDTRIRANDPMVLPHAIDLRAFFEWFDYNLDHELKQRYTLDIAVNGERMIITPIEEGGVGDWTEGGNL